MFSSTYSNCFTPTRAMARRTGSVCRGKILTVRLMPRAVHGVKLLVCCSPSTLSKPRPVGGVSNGLTKRELVMDIAADFALLILQRFRIHCGKSCSRLSS